MRESKNKFSPGTFLERSMYQSPAWFALNGTEKSILLLFLDKRSIHKQTKECLNCESLILTYKEVSRLYEISCDRMRRAINGLLERGFIRIRHRGGLGEHSNTIYALCDNWQEWKPGLNFGQRPKRKKQGFCGKGVGKLKNQKKAT